MAEITRRAEGGGQENAGDAPLRPLDVIVGTSAAETLSGTGGGDRISGGRGNDRLAGRAGRDVLEGNDGDDRLSGGKDGDRLSGGDGKDLLSGDDGNDVLVGGPGGDFLLGRAGADVFVLSELDGTFDRIRDFTPGEDRLDLSALLPTFKEGDDLSQFVDYRDYKTHTILRVDPDGADGPQGFQAVARLENVKVDALSAEDLGLANALPSEAVVASATADGTPGNGTSLFPALSLDGQYVTFASAAGNLIAGDDNQTFDVFRLDLTSGEVVRVSETFVPGTGVVAGEGNSFISSISADGNVVAFDSEASNFAPAATGTRDVFAAEVVGDGNPELVSIVNNRFAVEPSVDGAGELVAFQATATGRAEVAPTGEILERVYVREIDTGKLTEISKSAGGAVANDSSYDPDISADGHLVAFESRATNLVSGTDLNPGRDVFVTSLDDGSVRLVSTDAKGAQGFGDSGNASISGDGQFVAFHSTASFTAADTDGGYDIYVKDLQSGAITLVTSSEGGIKANGESWTPSISDDGSLVAFRSAASNLVDGDTNGVPDVFVKNLETNQILRFEVEGDSSNALFFVAEPALSGDGSRVAYVTDVDVGGEGGLDGGQVVVAPVQFQSDQALATADVIDTGPDPLGGAAATAPGGGGALALAPAADLTALVVQPEVA